MKAQRGSSSTLYLTSALDGSVCVVKATSRSLYLREGEPVPILHEKGSAPMPVCTGAKNLPPPGFDLRTVQTVASRYTD
jgi:hypothetical protein